jgi:hypothetical protein
MDFPFRKDTHTAKGKGQPLLLRKIRRDSDGEKIPCTCNDPVTHEGDGDAHCAYCDGVGFLWDELWFLGYVTHSASFVGTSMTLREMTMPGFIQTDEPFLYTFYYVTVQKDDWVCQPALDEEGNVIQPIRMQHRNRVISQFPMRMDGARIEYWKYKLRKHGV